MPRQTKRLGFILVTIAAILLVPLVAMQFTDEVKWTPSDFLVAGGLLLVTGLLMEFFLRRIKQRRYRILAVVILLAILLLIWAELAVGVFGTPFEGS